MIRLADLPEDNADLVKISVSFPLLDEDTEQSCPVSRENMLEYLSCEALDGENARSVPLIFVRTAAILKNKYWLWRFTDGDGVEAFLCVEQKCGNQFNISYLANDYGLTPEQYLLGQYYRVF